MQEEFDSAPVVIPDEPTAKPKRQLTEAQRLAFLKGREIRAKNIALRREQKLAEAENVQSMETEPAAEISPGADANVSTRKPPAKRARKSKAKPNPEPVEVIIDPVATPEQEKKEIECPDAPLVPVAAVKHEFPDPEEYAKRVAEIIYDKLNAEDLPLEPPIPPKPVFRRNNKGRAAARSDPKSPDPEPKIPLATSSSSSAPWLSWA